MQELKLSQTLDGANMSPYHTTGEFATSLVSLTVAYVPRRLARTYLGHVSN